MGKQTLPCSRALTSGLVKTLVSPGEHDKAADRALNGARVPPVEGLPDPARGARLTCCPVAPTGFCGLLLGKCHRPFSCCAPSKSHATACVCVLQSALHCIQDTLSHFVKGSSQILLLDPLRELPSTQLAVRSEQRFLPSRLTPRLCSLPPVLGRELRAQALVHRLWSSCAQALVLGASRKHCASLYNMP